MRADVTRRYMQDLKPVQLCAQLLSATNALQIPSVFFTNSKHRSRARPMKDKRDNSHLVACHLGQIYGHLKHYKPCAFAHGIMLWAAMLVSLASPNNASCCPILLLQNSCGWTTLHGSSLHLTRKATPFLHAHAFGAASASSVTAAATALQQSRVKGCQLLNCSSCPQKKNNIVKLASWPTWHAGRPAHLPTALHLIPRSRAAESSPKQEANPALNHKQKPRACCS